MQPLNVESATTMDLYGTYISAGDEGYLAGFGLTFNNDYFFDSYEESYLLYCRLYLAGRMDNTDEPGEESRMFIPLIAGGKIQYHIIEIPLFLELSAGAGAAYFIKQGPEKTGPFIDPSTTVTDQGIGPHFEFLAGLNYQANQYIAFFVEGGYHYTRFFTDNIADNASGFQGSLGIRFTLTGQARELN